MRFMKTGPGLCEFGILDYEGVVSVCVNPTLDVCQIDMEYIK